MSFQPPKHVPSILILVARDEVIRRRAPFFLNDIKSLTPEPALFDAFLRDVAGSLRIANEPELAAMVEAVRKP